jgi:hypothetical protein
MIYFKSRYISDALDIKLAKWKRWVREFLPPDPLSGRQSGYARNFNIRDAFHVYLAGYLVGTVGFSVAQARQIMSDLEPSLKRRGYHVLHPRGMSDDRNVFWVLIHRRSEGGFGYFEGPHKDTAPSMTAAWQPLSQFLSAGDFLDARIIAVHRLYRYFLDRLNP